MKTLTEGEAVALSAPLPYALITSLDKNGRPNAMGASWVTRSSFDPFLITISIPSYQIILNKQVLVDSFEDIGFVLLQPQYLRCSPHWQYLVLSSRLEDLVWTEPSLYLLALFCRSIDQARQQPYEEACRSNPRLQMPLLGSKPPVTEPV